MGRIPKFRAADFWYHQVVSLRVPIELFGALVRYLVRRAFGSRPWRGITLITAPPYNQVDLTEVVQALELIENIDPRSLHRIERHVRCIALVPSRWGLSRYWPMFRVCHLTKLPYTESTRRLAVCLYGQELVRVSSQALLDSRRFPHTRANMQRMKSISSKEAKRFVAKVVRRNREIADPMLGYLEILIKVFPSTAPVMSQTQKIR